VSKVAEAQQIVERAEALRQRVRLIDEAMSCPSTLHIGWKWRTDGPYPEWIKESLPVPERSLDSFLLQQREAAVKELAELENPQ
jgi:alkylated DNA repair dioxygenase AlkB